MSVSLLGGPLGFGSSVEQNTNSEKKTAASPFASLFQSATNQAKRNADRSILDAARQTDPASATVGNASGGGLELRRDAEATMGNLNRRLQQLFADADVDTSIDIQLVADGSGGVQVAGSHPDADKIQEILTDHPELAAQFQEMMSLFAKLQAANVGSLGATPSGTLTMIIAQQNARVANQPQVSGVE